MFVNFYNHKRTNGTARFLHCYCFHENYEIIINYWQVIWSGNFMVIPAPASFKNNFMDKMSVCVYLIEQILNPNDLWLLALEMLCSFLIFISELIYWLRNFGTIFSKWQITDSIFWRWKISICTETNQWQMITYFSTTNHTLLDYNCFIFKHSWSIFSCNRCSGLLHDSILAQTKIAH